MIKRQHDSMVGTECANDGVCLFVLADMQGYWLRLIELFVMTVIRLFSSSSLCVITTVSPHLDCVHLFNIFDQWMRRFVWDVVELLYFCLSAGYIASEPLKPSSFHAFAWEAGLSATVNSCRNLSRTFLHSWLLVPSRQCCCGQTNLLLCLFFIMVDLPFECWAMKCVITSSFHRRHCFPLIDLFVTAHHNINIDHHILISPIYLFTYYFRWWKPCSLIRHAYPLFSQFSLSFLPTITLTMSPSFIVGLAIGSTERNPTASVSQWAVKKSIKCLPSLSFSSPALWVPVIRRVHDIMLHPCVCWD